MRFVICLLLLLSTIACANSPLSPETKGYFTLVALPDTQNYSREYPDIFNSQTTWIKENTKDRNILFTVHLGDLVDTYNDEDQWNAARQAMNILKGLPYSVLPGNHDNKQGEDNTYFNHYFNYAEFSGYSWYSGHFPESGNENNSEVFTFAGIKYLILNMGFGAQTEAFNWAKKIISDNKDKKIILVTHSYLETDGSRTSEGEKLWQEIVSKYPNILMVLCGHMHGDTVSSVYGDKGNRIYEILSDYQDGDNGGNGFLRIYEFHPAEQTIKVSTYSPYTNEYESTKEGEFELSTSPK
jgi:3',5'-cyclic AMP phosphodiesterase CpdA